MTSAGPETPFPETADIETASDGYAARFAGPVGEWMVGRQESIVLKWLREEGGETVLDVGGGHGQLAAPLAREGFRVTVVGSSDLCGRRLGPDLDAGRIRFVVGNVIALPFPDRSFDGVVSVRVLSHCVRWPEFIRELCRVARRAVIVDYPAKQVLQRIAPVLFEAKKRLEGNTRAWRSFDPADIEREFASAGFIPHGREGQFFLPMVLHRTLRCRPFSAALEGPFRIAGLTRRWGSPVLARMVRPAPAR